jgi:hypothetical protein
VPAVTHTQNVTSDSWYANDGSNMGNGGGDRFGVGYSGSWVSPAWQTRFAIKIPRGTLFDGVPSAAAMTAFDIKLRAVNSCYGIGGAVRFFLERATTAMGENSQSGTCVVSTAGTAVTSRWPGPTRDTANRGGYSGSPASGDWLTVNMLALGQWWYAHPEVTELVLVGVAADTALTTYDESNTARQCVFYSRHTTSLPYAQLTYNDETPPDQPTELYPPDASTVGSTTGTQATVSGRYTQAQGLAATHYRFQWYPSSATDAVPGTPTVDTGSVAAATSSGSLRSYTFTGLAARTAGKWRVQFGRNGVWSAWSLLRAATTAYQPGVPSQVSVTPGTLTPTIGATLVSSDTGDFITNAQVLVYQDPAVGSTITKWDSGTVSVGGASNRLSLAYGGSGLVYGTKYRLRVRLQNRDGVWSDYTADVYFTPLEAVGPAVVLRQGGVSLAADLSVLVTSKTPTFRLSDPGAANIDRVQSRYYSPTGALLYDSGIVTVTSAATQDVVVPAGLWDWGQEPQADFAIRLTGNADMGPFRERVTVHLDTVPGAPGPNAVVATTDAVQRLDGVWVVPTATPTLSFPNRDTDLTLGYTDNPTRREIELRNMAGTNVGASPYVITTGITSSWTVPAAVLVAETQYEARARYDDAAAQRGPFSDYLYVKFSARPTVASVTPANAATVTDPTPTLAWTYAHTGGLPQGAYRATAANAAGTVLWDTGWVTSTAGTVTMPAGLLPNSSTITWTLQVRTTDGLVSTLLSRTFTTAFTQPAALTGVSVTPVPEALALDVAWAASALPAGEFVAYNIDARSSTGQWVRVKNIYVQATTSWRYYMAAHNDVTSVRVYQDNGYMTSAPAEASAELDVDGWWRLGSTDMSGTRMRYVQPGSHKRPRTAEQAVYSPAGAQYQRVITVGAWGITGAATVSVPPEDAEVVAQLVDDHATGRVIGWKTPFGLAAWVKLTDCTPTDGQGGWTDVALAYVEVGAEAAGRGPDD